MRHVRLLLAVSAAPASCFGRNQGHGLGAATGLRVGCASGCYFSTPFPAPQQVLPSSLFARPVRIVVDTLCERVHVGALLANDLNGLRPADCLRRGGCPSPHCMRNCVALWQRAHCVYRSPSPSYSGVQRHYTCRIDCCYSFLFVSHCSIGDGRPRKDSCPMAKTRAASTSWVASPPGPDTPISCAPVACNNGGSGNSGLPNLQWLLPSGAPATGGGQPRRSGAVVARRRRR